MFKKIIWNYNVKRRKDVFLKPFGLRVFGSE